MTRFYSQNATPYTRAEWLFIFRDGWEYQEEAGDYFRYGEGGTVEWYSETQASSCSPKHREKGKEKDSSASFKRHGKGKDRISSSSTKHHEKGKEKGTSSSSKPFEKGRDNYSWEYCQETGHFFRYREDGTLEWYSEPQESSSSSRQQGKTKDNDSVSSSKHSWKGKEKGGW